MSFAGDKNVLLVVSHQDDESFFCGGLLTTLRGNSRITAICMSEAKHPGDRENRDNYFEAACKIATVQPVTTSFQDARHVWSSVDLFFRDRSEQIVAMTKFLGEQRDVIRPDIVITHNEAGEYGHCYHKAVHRLCRRVFDPEKIYCFARGSKLQNREIIRVNYDKEKKRQLLACYPYFDVHFFSLRFFREDITYQPEEFFALGENAPVAAEPSLLDVYRGLSSDFLHFFHRKLRAKAKWY
jgi:LmbE family N-acetylglucosaminyl deacetylase